MSMSFLYKPAYIEAPVDFLNMSNSNYWAWYTDNTISIKEMVESQSAMLKEAVDRLTMGRVDDDEGMVEWLKSDLAKCQAEHEKWVAVYAAWNNNDPQDCMGHSMSASNWATGCTAFAQTGTGSKRNNNLSNNYVNRRNAHCIEGCVTVLATCGDIEVYTC